MKKILKLFSPMLASVLSLVIVSIANSSKGYVTQLVHEHHSNPYAKLYGEYYNESGFAKGCWSPDSVYESGTTYYN